MVADSAVCSIEGCGRPLRARGWCNMHWRRWNIHGDPGEPTARRTDREANFWSFVDPNGPIPAHRPKLGRCAEWTGARSYGYGSLRVRNVQWAAHRLAWTLAQGPIPVGMQVLHHCDNPPCCRPSHLFLGTYQDNVDDRQAKGRMPRTLSEPQVLGIIELLADGRRTRRSIADTYGISMSSVNSIAWGKTWKELSGRRSPDPSDFAPEFRCNRCGRTFASHRSRSIHASRWCSRPAST